MEFDDVNYHEDEEDYDADLLHDEENNIDCPRCSNGCNYCLMTE